RSLVQLFRLMVRNGRETRPAHGVKRQGPNGFPPTSIMADLSDTGTHNHQRTLGEGWSAYLTQQQSMGVMGPRVRGDDADIRKSGGARLADLPNSMP
ncbi:MAG TPA: hypothetical protein VN065_19685, partial [Bradyrhizobium sp.]|nr:hypothetical protein [Bradyrhizobium sp.]